MKSALFTLAVLCLVLMVVTGPTLWFGLGAALCFVLALAIGVLEVGK